MAKRTKKFLSYYKPYMRLFYADIGCAIMVSAITLAIPLCIGYITKNLLEQHNPDALFNIYVMGGVMLLLVALYAACHFFIDYKGHVMGSLMEGDIRNDLFDHLQKLSFSFYDEHRTGELMTRISNDSFDLAELYHHGPEDIVIAFLNFIGAFIILLTINVKLATVALLFLPIMALYGLYFSNKMHVALRKSQDRVGNINAQVEDTLSESELSNRLRTKILKKKIQL